MAGKPLRHRALKYAALLGALHLVLNARTSRQEALPSSASSESTTSQERPARPVSELGAVVLKYVALAAAAGALLFAMKTLLFTGMNAQVAAALVANTSASTAVQMLLAVTPEIGFVLGLVAVYQAGRLSKRGNPENDPSGMCQRRAPLAGLVKGFQAPSPPNRSKLLRHLQPYQEQALPSSG